MEPVQTEENKIQTIIKATPEIVMHGVKKSFTPRVMQCCTGGYIIVFEGQGMAAKSTWAEVIECIADVGAACLGEPIRGPDLPNIAKEEHAPYEEQAPKLSPVGVLHATLASIITLFLAFSVRIT